MAQRTDGPRALGLAGPVMLIGGAEDKRRDMVILRRFVELAGGPDAHIVTISTASTLGEQAAERYGDLFRSLGAGRTTGLRPQERREANDPAVTEPLGDATGVFLTGGNQIRLISAISGTHLEDALVRARDRGAVIAGTSAGASAAATHMVAFGRSGASPKHRMIHISAGLGLVDGVIVDQHFEQRGRMGRLMAAVALAPRLIGIGLDEDTAAIIWPDRTLEVLGRGSVTLVDGSHIATDSFQTKGHRPMMVSGAVVHALPAGYRFDLRTRALLSSGDGEEREASR
ncbi:MAG TPA: cyanophycinase [Actinomycetota bacterium]|nr:cyanophycinase [Actinomycetota bacterium]